MIIWIRRCQFSFIAVGEAANGHRSPVQNNFKDAMLPGWRLRRAVDPVLIASYAKSSIGDVVS